MRQETIHNRSNTRNMKKRNLSSRNKFLVRKLQIYTKSYNPMEFTAIHKVVKMINEKVSQLKILRVSGISVATRNSSEEIKKNVGGEMNG